MFTSVVNDDILKHSTELTAADEKFIAITHTADAVLYTYWPSPIAGLSNVLQWCTANAHFYPHNYIISFFIQV